MTSTNQTGQERPSLLPAQTTTAASTQPDHEGDGEGGQSGDPEHPLGLDRDGVSLVLTDAHLREFNQTTYRHEQVIEDSITGNRHQSVGFRIDDERELAIVTRGQTVNCRSFTIGRASLVFVHR